MSTRICLLSSPAPLSTLAFKASNAMVLATMMDKKAPTETTTRTTSLGWCSAEAQSLGRSSERRGNLLLQRGCNTGGSLDCSTTCCFWPWQVCGSYKSKLLNLCFRIRTGTLAVDRQLCALGNDTAHETYAHAAHMSALKLRTQLWQGRA